MGGLAESGIISFTENNSLSFPDAVARGDVSLTDSGTVFVSASADDMTPSQAGNIKITTGSLTVNNDSALAANGDEQDRGGNVTIDATGDVSFANDSIIFVFGAGGGSIQLDAKNLSLTSDSKLFGGIGLDLGFAEAQSGDIKINLGEDLVLDGLDGTGQTYIANNSFDDGKPGNIEINARNITLQNGGFVGSTGGSTQEISIQSSVGDIKLNAQKNILFDGFRSGIQNFIGNGTSGDVGVINVQAQNLTLTNGGMIQSQVAGSADGGDLNIDVADSIKVDGFGNDPQDESLVLSSAISSNVADAGTGNAGKININTQNLEISRNGFIGGQNYGQGNGGDININAEQINIGKQGNVNFSPSSISTQKFPGSEGNGGNITIDTGSLFINDGTDIDAGVSGQGNGGNISINARDTVSVDGTGTLLDNEVSGGIFADAFNSVGDAGNIEIATSKLSVTNGAGVSADILGNSTQGNGGDIDINASDSVNVSRNGYIRASVVAENSPGNGGDITISASNFVNLSANGLIAAIVLEKNSSGNSGNLSIETERLIMADGLSFISTSSFGNGNAGSLSINAESIELRGSTETMRSNISANALDGKGNGGDINIVTRDLTIADGATIAASNFPSFENSTVPPGTGQPGNINIQANSIRLENGGRIVAATQSTKGEGANINLQVADDITLQGDSFISAQAFGDANGGNLKIDSEFIVAFPDGNNDIFANAQQGKGGNIAINAESLFGIEERPLNDSTNDINASSDFNLDGTININTSRIDPLQGATELPSNVVEAKQTSEQTCSADRDGKVNNGLAIAGRGGVTPAPDLPLNSENISNENSAQASIPEPIETSQGKIQPARGIKFTKDGRIILTAYRTNNAGERIPEAKNNCGQI